MIEDIIRSLQESDHLDLDQVASELHLSKNDVLVRLLDLGANYNQLSFSFNISKSTIAAAKGKRIKPMKEATVVDLPPEIKLPGDCTGFVVPVHLSPGEIRWLQTRYIKRSIREKLDEAYYQWRSQRK